MKNVVIWANCQGSAIGMMLNKYYPNEFNVNIYANYEYIKNNIKLPDFMYICDIFIYQNYSDNHCDYNIKNIIDNILPKQSIKLCFPTLHRNYLQFPFDVNSVENAITIDKNYPHGKFFFGIDVIRNIVNELIDSNNDKDKIKNIVLDKIKETDFIKNDVIKKYECDTIVFLQTKALSSDIPQIYDFIINNYKIKRLYHNPNHPNGILLNELCKLIFEKLNLKYTYNDLNITQLDKILKDWKMPIFNSVIKYYDMKNVDNDCSSFFHNDIKDVNTYIAKYVDFLIE